MISLQVLTPSMPCMFHCPFCISKTHEHQNFFQDNYTKNHDRWLKNYIEVLMTSKDLSYVVITGTNEPMQSKECVEEIAKITHQFRPDIQVELQTRYYLANSVYPQLDLVAYSISDYSMLDRIKPSGKKNRFVILLTKSFEDKSLQEILGRINPDVTQVTFKVLHDSHGYNTELDNWIEEYGMSLEKQEELEKEVQNYPGELSIRFDKNCMQAENRYQIFREDGNVYENWETKEKVLNK